MDVQCGKYQHYKGDIMEVIGKALHSETMEEFVVYKHVAGARADQGHFWVRPVAMFYGNGVVDGKEVPRFRYLG